jgi:hypothetical protein
MLKLCYLFIGAGVGVVITFGAFLGSFFGSFLADFIGTLSNNFFKLLLLSK